MSLQISEAQLQQIFHHLETVYPQEGCGLLIGQVGSDSRRMTSEVWPADNAWAAETTEVGAVFDEESHFSEHSLHDRYWIDPKFLLAAQRYCSDRGQKIIGIYHSHPNHPAIPSECDRALAWPEYSYLIVSVHQGAAQESQSWCLNPQHQFKSEALIVQP